MSVLCHPSIADPMASHNLSALSPLLALRSHRSNRFLCIKPTDHFSHFLAFANSTWTSWNYSLLPQPFWVMLWVTLYAYCMPLGLQQRSLKSSFFPPASKLPFIMGPQDLSNPCICKDILLQSKITPSHLSFLPSSAFSHHFSVSTVAWASLPPDTHTALPPLLSPLVLMALYLGEFS